MFEGAQGSLDRCDLELIAGWIWFPGAPGRTNVVELRCGGVLLASCVADRYRQDVADARVGDGRCGFRFEPPAGLSAADLPRIELPVVGTGVRFVHGVWGPQPAARPERRSRRRRAKRFKTCILHIGAEKTGSSTLQAFLGVNRAALARRGVFVPQTLAPHAADGVFNHSHLAAQAVDEKLLGEDLHAPLGIDGPAALDAFRSGLAAGLAAELKGAPGGCETLLVSNEHCHSRLLSTQAVARVKALLDPHCESYRVIVYLRAQHELAMSLYGMMLLLGCVNIDLLPPMAPPPDYARMVYASQAYFDYAALLERWTVVFGRAAMRPRVFERAGFAGGTVVGDFLQTAEIGGAGFAPVPPRNGNVSAAAQRFLIELYSEAKAAEIEAAQRAMLAETLRAVAPGDGILPTREQVTAFMAQFAGSNERVRGVWFAQRRQLFEVDLARFARG